MKNERPKSDIMFYLPGSIIKAPIQPDPFNPAFCDNFCDMYDE